jgi:hypothetical protein
LGWLSLSLSSCEIALPHDCASMALKQNSATIANGASTVIAVAALGISSRHNYIGSIRGKGIECPRTLANLRLPQHLAPPSQGSLSFISRPQSKFSHPSSGSIRPKLPQVEINASSLCEGVALSLSCSLRKRTLPSASLDPSSVALSAGCAISRFVHDEPIGGHNA